MNLYTWQFTHIHNLHQRLTYKFFKLDACPYTPQVQRMLKSEFLVSLALWERGRRGLLTLSWFLIWPNLPTRVDSYYFFLAFLNYHQGGQLLLPSSFLICSGLKFRRGKGQFRSKEIQLHMPVMAMGYKFSHPFPQEKRYVSSSKFEHLGGVKVLMLRVDAVLVNCENPTPGKWEPGKIRAIGGT